LIPLKGGDVVDLGSRVPLLDVLPKVQLARLVADLHVQDLPAGTLFHEPDTSQQWLYFVLRGEVQVTDEESEQEIPILILGPGEVIGETAFGPVPPDPIRLRAMTDAQVGRIPLTRFKRLLESEPILAQRFIRMLAARTDMAVHELARIKRLLTVYERELWDNVSTPTAPCASSQSKEAQPPPPEPVQPLRRRRRPAKGRTRLNQTWGQTSSALLPAAIAFLAYRAVGGAPTQATAAAILGGAAGFWLLGTIPDYATALAAAVLSIVIGVAPAKVVLSGFANPSWFLLLGVLGIGVAVSRSGLVYRSALHMMRLLPPTYYGQSLALALTGLFLTPLLPSSNSRVALVSPLAQELSEAMRFQPHSKGSAGLAMSGFLGFGQMYFFFFSGANICMLAWSLLPSSVRDQIDWIQWFILALPLGLFTFFGGYAAILILFRPEQGPGISAQTIGAQLKILGPMSWSEKATATVLGGVLLGFFSQGWHGIDPGWVALAGFLLLVVLGVLNREGLKLVDWGFLLLVGTLVGLFEVTRVTGLSDILSDWVGRILAPLGSSPFLFLTGVAVLTIIVRLAIPLQQAVLLMVLALSPIAVKMGYNPFAVALVVLAMSNTWLLPQQNSMYLAAYSGTDERCFNHKQVRPLALLQTGFGILAVVASVPYWSLLGLLPR
jgi:anion transporter